MPNHIHGILILNNPEIPKEEKISEGNIEGGKDDSPGNHPQMAKISPKSNSISTIIRSYKSATTKHAHRLGFEFEWQTRFYDIIIRDEIAFDNISHYIKNNPAKWKEDKFR